MSANSGHSENWAFKPGDSFQQYTVIRLLGAGLHGEVYLIEHRLTHDRFALKVMHLEDVRQASRVRRALSTALASYRIQHANVVTVHDIGCEEDGMVWVRMEYLDGCSIGDLLARQRGRVSIQLAFYVAIEAAWGIDAAHEMQIIHRDIKPENLWLTAAGRVKVIDFSLAKVIPDGIPTTQRKTGFGTAPYMAPEALKGAVPDARVDGYGLGMVLWQMLGGRHPWHEFLRSTTEMIRRQLHVMPPLLSKLVGLPMYVDDFMARALAKDPAERFLTIAEMARAMMTLRDRLRDDAARGVFAAEIPAGEPRFPSGEAWRGRKYHGTHDVAEGAPEPAAPSHRVVVAATQRLPKGLGGTLPLPSSHAPIVAEPMGARPAAFAPPPTGSEAPPMPATPAPRDTATAVTRSGTHEAAPARAPSSSRALLVVLAVVAALATSVVLVARRRGHRTTPQAQLPASSAPAASAAAPLAAVDSAVPRDEPPEPPSAASEASATPTVMEQAPARTAEATTNTRRAPARPAPRTTARAASTPAPNATAKTHDPPAAPDPPPPPKPAPHRVFDAEP